VLAAGVLVVTEAAFLALGLLSRWRGITPICIDIDCMPGHISSSPPESTAWLDGVTVAAVAGVVLAIVSFIYGGVRLAGWAVVGLAMGLAANFHRLPQLFPLGPKQDVLLALAGAAVGALLVRVLGVVPWEGLAVIAAGVVLWSNPPGTPATPAIPSVAGGDWMDLLIAAALAAGAVRQAGQPTPARGTGPAVSIAALVGFGAYLIGVTMTSWPLTTGGQPVYHRYTLTIGLAGLVALVLSLVLPRPPATTARPQSRPL
jgi:hypothetical protein